jgi:hypothetical protein
MKITEEENSFEKVAEDLHLTPERVRLYWENWINKNENLSLHENLNHQEIQDESSPQTRPLVNGYPLLNGEMQAKHVSPHKIIFIWDSSELPKLLFQHYFNIDFDSQVQMLRIYDVTQIQFNGKNAHHFYDLPVPHQQGYWFVKGLFSNRSYVADIGVEVNGRDFFPLLRSNSIQMPKLGKANNHEFYQDVHQLHHYREQIPSWREHVSTYSYYLHNEGDGGGK